MRNILYILLFVCISITVRSQTDTSAKARNELFRKGNVSFGLKVGYTQSNIYGSDINYIFANNNTSNLASFHVGITINSMVGKYFWLKHELLIVQKGAGVTLTDSINGNYSSALKMLSLNLFPISPCFHFKGLQLYAGPYISALLDAQITRKDKSGKEYQDHSVFGDGSQFENKSKYLQKMDFGLNAGIEYQFPFGLLIGAKYTQGFSNTFQYANTYTFNDPKKEIKIYNKAFLVSIGYSFVKRKTK
jgi:hypothetical protein